MRRNRTGRGADALNHDRDGFGGLTLAPVPGMDNDEGRPKGRSPVAVLADHLDSQLTQVVALARRSHEIRHVHDKWSDICLCHGCAHLICLLRIDRTRRPPTRAACEDLRGFTANALGFARHRGEALSYG